MAKQQSGEGKAPLVIALVFFVLLSLGLGYFVYAAEDQKNILRDAAKKAKDDQGVSDKLRASEKEKILLYKAAIGTASPEEFDTLKNMTNEADVHKEYDALVSELANRIGTRERPGPLVVNASKDFVGTPGAQINLTSNDLFAWPWPAGAKLDKLPDQTILGSLVSAHAKAALATAKANVAAKSAAVAEQAYKQGLDDAAKEKQGLKDVSAQFPPRVAKIQTDADADKAATRKTFADKTKDYTTKEREFNDKLSEKDIKIGAQEQTITGLREQIRRLQEEVSEVEDPFPFDTPHGRVVDRRGNMVTIDLGSADRVREGTTFKVRPADALSPGGQAKMVPKLDRNGRQMVRNGRPVMEIPAKGMIEVTRVLGPKQSLARVTDTVDPIREGIMTGDLLFNAAWRRDGSDRVALFGVFDLDGDGVDDVRTVIRDLQKMGIGVDAYFDLDQKKWIDPNTGKPTQITPQTTYTIEGYYPPATGGEAIAGAKSAIDAALRTARTEAQEKGSKVVRMREFFPRIGYKINLAVGADSINRAYSRYMNSLPPASPPPEGGAGDMPPPKN